MASLHPGLTRALILAAALVAVGSCDEDRPAVPSLPTFDAAADPPTLVPTPPLSRPTAPETDAGTGGADGAGTPTNPPPDPCAGEKPEGSCPTPGTARTCVAATGNASPQLVQTSCASYERCTQTRFGVVACAPMEGACEPGASACEGTDRISVCKDARWQTLPCPGGCLQTALGDFCRLQVDSVPYQASVEYTARGPNAEMTDWSPTTFTAPAQGMVVASFRGDDVIDADITAADGSFTVQVPKTLGPDDRVIVLLVHPTDAKTGLAIAIGRPDVPDGVLDPREAGQGKPAIWQWAIDPSRNPSGSKLTIGEADGSGAVRLFDNLRRVYAETRRVLKDEGKPLIVWLRMNTGWLCGACHFQLPAKVGPVTFFRQIAISAVAEDTAFWSDAVISHELFHWVMGSYGASPNEGGRHCLGVPTLPGQAWSEGFATGFSSIIRKSPLYFDKQDATFFWFDIARRVYVRNKPWQRPKPEAGLQQLHDENDLAAMLYALAGDAEVGSDRMLRALTSPRMTRPPFERGYVTQRWDLGKACVPTNITKTNQSAPFLADFLDALRCDGVPAARIDAVTEPADHYPYPSQSPLCR